MLLQHEGHMACAPYALETRAPVWFGRDTLVIICSRNTSVIMFWVWMVTEWIKIDEGLTSEFVALG